MRQIPAETENCFRRAFFSLKSAAAIFICMAAAFFARYARRAAAVLARAGIRRATVIEWQCREMSEASR